MAHSFSTFPTSRSFHPRSLPIYTYIVLLFSLALSLASPSLALAATSGISQGYDTKSKDIVPGTIMSLDTKGSIEAVPANAAQRPQLLGVVTDEALISLNNGDSRVQISLEGTAPAYVSDLNGDVKAGDRITASPIEGIGMKATGSGVILGTAGNDLTSIKTTSRTIVDAKGVKHTVHIGLLSVRLNVGYSSGTDDSPLASFIPPFLMKFAGNVAGKDVSGLRVIESVSALLIGFGIAAVMLRSGIRSGIISLGRNPLASKTIKRGIMDVYIASAGVLLVTIMSIYVILRI